MALALLMPAGKREQGIGRSGRVVALRRARGLLNLAINRRAYVRCWDTHLRRPLLDLEVSIRRESILQKVMGRSKRWHDQLTRKSSMRSAEHLTHSSNMPCAIVMDNAKTDTELGADLKNLIEPDLAIIFGLCC